MVDDDHVHDNTKNTWIWQMIISKLLRPECSERDHGKRRVSGEAKLTGPVVVPQV